MYCPIHGNGIGSVLVADSPYGPSRPIEQTVGVAKNIGTTLILPYLLTMTDKLICIGELECLLCEAE